MANKISLTQENIKYIRDAFSHFFPEDIIYSADKPYVSGEFNWNNRRGFINFVYRLTGVEIKSEKDFGNIKKAQLAVEDLVETTESEEKVTSNVPEKGLREEQEVERQRREAALKESTESAKKNIEASIKRQQQLAEELKNKKVYVKAEAPKTTELINEEQNSIDTLKKAAEADPKRLVDQITGEIEKRIASSNPQADPKEVHLLAEQAAYDTVKNLQGQSLAQEAVISNAVAKGNVAVTKIVTKEGQSTLQQAASDVKNQQILEYTVSRDLASSTFGENFASNVFGPKKLDDFRIEFSSKPNTGFVSYDLSQIPNNFSASLGDQGNFLGSIKDFGVGKIKSQFLEQASIRLEGWIGQLPSNSFLAQTYNNELVQGALSYFGLGGSSVAWEGTTFFGRLAVDNGFGPIIGWLGEKTGIDFGIASVATDIGGEIVGSGLTGEAAASLVAGETAATLTGEVAAVAGGEAAGAAVGTAIVPIPIIGTIVGAVVGWLASKIDWQKVGPFLVGAVVGLGVGIVAGLGVGIAAGVGAGLLTSGITGGLPSLSSIGSGIAGFTTALASAMVAAIGIPILVTLLVFPVVVALILFIINSGAYVVPTTGIANVTCNIDQSSGQTSQTYKSTAANAAVCIVSYLNEFGLNPLLVGLLDTPSWQNLVKALPAPALEALQISAPVDGHLQCVGFAAATAGWAYGQAFGQINACSYINNPPAGYSYVSGTTGIQSGDFFLINGSHGCSASSPGHIGVVISVDGALISCADANMIGPGETRVANGCFALSQLTGYLRR
ncbi:MAG: hypothetical protein ABSC49_00740 [Candidatus Microgenomates bacterium]|jgi:hypothetical protein